MNISRVSVLVCSVVLILACSGQVVKAEEKKTPTTARNDIHRGELKSKQEVLVTQLLYEANDALLRNRLTKPAYDNAYERYQKVLLVDPVNDTARIGIKRIGRRYLTLAKEADRQGDGKKALQYVNVAARIDPDYPAIAHMYAYLNAAKKQQVSAGNVYYLDRRDLGARNAVIKGLLGDIGRRAQSIDSRLLIVGRSDAEGRWIYQQMRNATTNYRLRGNVERAKQPKVVLLDAPLE